MTEVLFPPHQGPRPPTYFVGRLKWMPRVTWENRKKHHILAKVPLKMTCMNFSKLKDFPTPPNLFFFFPLLRGSKFQPDFTSTEG